MNAVTLCHFGKFIEYGCDFVCGFYTLVGSPDNHINRNTFTVVNIIKIEYTAVKDTDIIENIVISHAAKTCRLKQIHTISGGNIAREQERYTIFVSVAAVFTEQAEAFFCKIIGKCNTKITTPVFVGLIRGIFRRNCSEKILGAKFHDVLRKRRKPVADIIQDNILARILSGY